VNWVTALESECELPARRPLTQEIRVSKTTTAVWPLSGFGDEIDPDPAVQAAVLLALGASHIEVRSAWGTNVSELEPPQVATLKEILDEKGLKVSAVASPIGKVDVSLPVEHEVRRLRQIISVAKGLDTKYIRIFSFYRAESQSQEDIRDDVMARLGALAAEAAEAGVVLLHENEKGIYGDIPERVLDIMKTVDSPSLRIAWDNANFVQVGVKPYTDGYAVLRPYLEYFQVKDALCTTGEVVPSGEGDGELDATIAALKEDGFTGFASLEPHLASAHELGGFSGPVAFGIAARAFAALAAKNGVELS
jgi:sugar phosphate isomerase/epimerase